MQVYIVVHGADHEGDTIESVWSTSEAAEAAADAWAKEWLGGFRRRACSYVNVETYNLDGG